MRHGWFEEPTVRDCSRMRIAIFQSNMKIGGIQRSLYTLLQSDVLAGQQVSLLLFDSEPDYDLSVLPKNVTIQCAKKLNKLSRAVPFPAMLRVSPLFSEKPADSYDVAIDFDGYSPETACAALRCKAAKKVIWAHNDYRERSKCDPEFRLMLWAFKPKFKMFDRVVAVSQGVADALVSVVGDSIEPPDVIPNLVPVGKIAEDAAQEVDFSASGDEMNVVCVGRLDRVKNPSGSLTAFLEALKVNPRLHLYFLGDGPLRSAIEDSAASAGVTDKVTVLGAHPNPYPYMAQMDALLLNSLFEGQGIVLREAQALGLQLIFPKRLERYNRGLSGVDDVCGALAALEKNEVVADRTRLNDYNNSITAALAALLGI